MANRLVTLRGEYQAVLGRQILDWTPLGSSALVRVTYPGVAWLEVSAPFDMLSSGEQVCWQVLEAIASGSGNEARADLHKVDTATRIVLEKVLDNILRGPF